MTSIATAFSAGYECLSAWSDLLDRINVFPVADGDTGTNLRISLAPLRDLDARREVTIDRLGRSATGNSGNIAAAFFRELAGAMTIEQLPGRIITGRQCAWNAVANPREGTMLSIFAAVADTLAEGQPEAGWRAVHEPMRTAVLAGTELIPEITRAGVVDSGALAMFIFFDGFFHYLDDGQWRLPPVDALFPGRLEISGSAGELSPNKYCIDALLEGAQNDTGMRQLLQETGDSIVILDDAEHCKVHIHTADPEQLRRRLAAVGTIVDWEDELIDDGRVVGRSAGGRPVVHIVTDAAGSLPKDLAVRHGISLLDSYIVTDGQAHPESLCCPQRVYHLLRHGQRATTAQASTYERHLHYERIVREHEHSLYLCVGSAYTGNFEVAEAWRRERDAAGRFEVLDTGAASGRLGLISLLTARFAETVRDCAAIAAFARQQLSDCEEYVFIDELRYLVAGGRVSRAGGFFGDLLQMKPVISPMPEGVRKRGLVRSRAGQLDFGIRMISRRFQRTDQPTIMLQYSDNEEWLKETVVPGVTSLLPLAEIIVVPLSLTSGVHMGPGTWAMAFSPYHQNVL